MRDRPQLPLPRLDLPLGAAVPDAAVVGHQVVVVVLHRPLALERPREREGVVPGRIVAITKTEISDQHQVQAIYSI